MQNLLETFQKLSGIDKIVDETIFNIATTLVGNTVYAVESNGRVIFVTFDFVFASIAASDSIKKDTSFIKKDRLSWLGFYLNCLSRSNGSFLDDFYGITVIQALCPELGYELGENFLQQYKWFHTGNFLFNNKKLCAQFEYNNRTAYVELNSGKKSNFQYQRYNFDPLNLSLLLYQDFLKLQKDEKKS